MEELDRYTKPGFQVNNEANEPYKGSPPPQYFPLTFIPPQQAPTCHLGFQQGMDHGVEEPINQQPARPVLVKFSISEGNDLRPQHRSYLYFSIFNLLCCCLPIGFFALQSSLKARRCADQNNPDGAAYYGSKALKLNLFALVIGIILEITMTVLYFFKYNFV